MTDAWTQDVLDHAETDAHEAGFQREDADDAFEAPAGPRTEQETREVLVRQDRAPGFVKSFARFSRTAKRYGQTLEITKTETVYVRAPDPAPPTAKVARTKFTVSIPPMLGEKGRILGRYERAEDGKSFYVHVIDATRTADVEAVRDRLGSCDHCGTRRDRHVIFVAETAEGVKAVGKSCVKDFLGIDPAWALDLWSAFGKLDEEEREERSAGGGGDLMLPTLDVVLAAHRVARKHGGYSRDMAETLRGHLSVLLLGAKTEDEIKLKRAYKDFDPEFDFGGWAGYLDRADGDFGANLRLALGQELLSTRRWGLILAGVGLWVGRIEKVQAVTPEWRELAAPVGARLEFTAEIVRTIPFDSQFGGGLIIIMNADGARVVHFYSGRSAPDAGETCKVKATVKKHQTSRYDGKPETLVTRAVYTPTSKVLV